MYRLWWSSDFSYTHGRWDFGCVHFRFKHKYNPCLCIYYCHNCATVIPIQFTKGYSSLSKLQIKRKCAWNKQLQKKVAFGLLKFFARLMSVYSIGCVSSDNSGDLWDKTSTLLTFFFVQRHIHERERRPDYTLGLSMDCVTTVYLFLCSHHAIWQSAVLRTDQAMDWKLVLSGYMLKERDRLTRDWQGKTMI